MNQEPQMSRPSLLLVDDDEIFRESLARALHRRGHRVWVAGDHAAAMQLARAESPDLAVVDLRMPGRSGLELVRDLKSAVKGVQIIVLTGYGSIATAVEATRMGAINYLPKPADAEDVLAAFQVVGSSAADEIPVAVEAPTLARAEWEHIHRILADCGGNISEAARRLGIHRRSLQRKLQKFAPKR